MTLFFAGLWYLQPTWYVVAIEVVIVIVLIVVAVVLEGVGKVHS